MLEFLHTKDTKEKETFVELPHQEVVSPFDLSCFHLSPDRKRLSLRDKQLAVCMRWGSLTDFSKVRATYVSIAKALNQKVSTV